MKNKTITRPLLITVLILMVVLGFKYTSVRQLASEQNKITEMTEEKERTKPAFDYTVTSLSSNEIVLDGEKGSMTLPKESVTVYDGTTETVVEKLKVGNKIKLEFIPGQRAWLYIQ
jgi:hypothetical protein